MVASSALVRDLPQQCMCTRAQLERGTIANGCTPRVPFGCDPNSFARVQSLVDINKTALACQWIGSLALALLCASAPSATMTTRPKLAPSALSVVASMVSANTKSLWGAPLQRMGHWHIGIGLHEARGGVMGCQHHWQIGTDLAMPTMPMALTPLPSPQHPPTPFLPSRCPLLSLTDPNLGLCGWTLSAAMKAKNGRSEMQ